MDVETHENCYINLRRAMSHANLGSMSQSARRDLWKVYMAFRRSGLCPLQAMMDTIPVMRLACGLADQLDKPVEVVFLSGGSEGLTN